MAITGNEIIQALGKVPNGAPASVTFSTTATKIANLTGLTGQELVEVMGATPNGVPSGQSFFTTTSAVSTLTGLTGNEIILARGVLANGAPSGQNLIITTGQVSSLAPKLVAMANNANIPTNFNTGAAWVHNCWTTHVSGPTSYTNVEVTFLNGLISTNSEQNAGYDFNLNVGIYLNGVFYQGLCNGSSVALVSKSWGTATFVFPTMPAIPANTKFYVTNRRVAADGGVAGSYDVITSTGGITQRQDGVIGGTDSTKNYTLGGALAFGAANNRVTSAQITGGAVTAVTRATGGGGVNYSGGLNLGPWYGPAGAGAKGATIPGSGIGGYANTSGGQYTTTSITGGGTGHDTNNPPYIFIGGGSTEASGFGTTTATYGPSLIAGKPAVSVPSILLHGDSIMAGYGSVDDTGDLSASYGSYEQKIAGTCGLFKMAVSGESATGWLLNNTKQLAFIDAMIARGLKISEVIIGLGVNDFLSNTNSDVGTVTLSSITSIANIWIARGAKIITTTIPPYTTSTDSFVTTANQTVGNTNYTSGGRVDIYNTAILAGLPVSNAIIDIRTLSQSTVDNTKWRVDTYGGSTAFCATDGIHLSKQAGIPYFVINATIPTLAT